MPKYEHPDHMIQDYTEICLRCGKNTYSSDECIAPPVQEEEKFKSGDYVYTFRPSWVKLSLTGGGRSESEEMIKRAGVVLGVCKYHYNCYKVCDYNKPQPGNFMQYSCTRFDRVQPYGNSVSWDSKFSPGEQVFIKNPAPKDSSNRWDFGNPPGAEIVLATLKLKMPTEKLWFVEVPRKYFNRPSEGVFYVGMLFRECELTKSNQSGTGVHYNDI